MKKNLDKNTLKKKSKNLIYENFDYDKYYLEFNKDELNLYIKQSEWKSEILTQLISDEKTNSILEIGTGHGYVLNSLNQFKIKIGLDISIEALKGQMIQYFSSIDYKKINSIHNVKYNKIDVINFFPNRNNILCDDLKKIYLILFNSEEGLPFENFSVDFVLLCDIIEHVENPSYLLKEAARVGKNVLVKIPVEKAFLTKLYYKLKNIKYGINHPSGHLYCWKIKDIVNLIRSENLDIKILKFIPARFEQSKKKLFLNL